MARHRLVLHGLLVAVSTLPTGCGSNRTPAPSPATQPGSHLGFKAPVAITGVTVIDVTARDAPSAVQAGQTVLIEDGRIAAIGPATSVTPARGARIVDGRGRYLLPGLWDAHAHTGYAGEAALLSFVANGVTSVRDLGGGSLSELLALRGRISDGSRVGPRLFVAGPNVEGAWWLDRLAEFAASDTILRRFPLLEISPRYRLASPQDAPTAVDSLLRLGVDVIKFRNLRGDEFRALASHARRRGVPLVGHAPRRVSLAEAADSGMSSIEHAETATLVLGDSGDAYRRDQFARMARAGTAITATLVTELAFRQTPDSIAYAVIADTSNRRDPRRRYVTPALLQLWKFGLDLKRLEGPTDWAGLRRRQIADLRRARDAGTPILVGTDFGVSLVYPGFSVHEELRLLVEEVGLSPLEALRGATLYPARTLRREGWLGVVATGQPADLLLLDADPLQDIRNTSRIRAVVAAGRLLLRPDLDSLLVEAERLARASPSLAR